MKSEEHTIYLLLLSILVAFNRGTITAARQVDIDPNRRITFYITGTVPSFARRAMPPGLFKGQGQINPSTNFLTFLTPLHALEAGKLKFINQEFRGEGETGTTLMGRVDGVQVTSLGDNTSSILALEASFASTTGESKDSLRFFGACHDDATESQVAVIGGTGKYEEASGFAIVKGGDGEGSSSNDFGFTVYLKFSSNGKK